MNSKAKGTYWENEVKAWYEAKGLYCIRAAGSHGDYDLIAIAKGGDMIYGIQCKTDKGMLRPEERERMLHLAMTYGIVPVYAHPAGGPYSKKGGNVIAEEVTP